MESTLRAIRGAIDAAADSKADVGAATERLFSAILERNGLAKADLVSLVISVTDDLKSMNPATVVRGMGYGDLPLMCLREAEFEEGHPRTIRMLLHCLSRPSERPIHVYLDGARALRPDLAD